MTAPVSQRCDTIFESMAISASLLCLVHCLALPVLLLLLPGVIGLFAQSEAFHYAALALVVPAALAAFWLGWSRHRAMGPMVLGALGAICLIAALLPHMHDAETGLTVTGSLLLVTGHMLNWRLRRRAAAA